MLYPLTFHPLFKERVWGGRKLEQLYRKPLPPRVPIGESWEISDRPDAVSVVANGPLAGRDLRWLMEHEEPALMGNAGAASGRFPLLVKLLDARQKLSLQVHPPAKIAARLGGEPKTEMWYIAEADPGAELFVGLRRGSTRAEFEQRLESGTVAECFHRLPVKAGDAMFLPSGRVHAIGAGLVIFEIQQNSDTTYRVFDWNRVGLDGRPRELHLQQSLESIDFSDFEPGLAQAGYVQEGPAKVRSLVADPLFSVRVVKLPDQSHLPLQPNCLQLVAAMEGQLQIRHKVASVQLSPGEFCLVPAALNNVEIEALSDSTLLHVEPGADG
jgi:mannose-6-phosphate isomerase